MRVACSIVVTLFLIAVQSLCVSAQDTGEYEKSKKLYVFFKFYECVEGIKGVTYYEGVPTGLLVEIKAKKDEIDSELNETGLKGAFSVKELKSSDGTLWYYELLKGLNTYITYEDTGDPEYPAGHVYNVDEMEDLYISLPHPILADLSKRLNRFLDVLLHKTLSTLK